MEQGDSIVCIRPKRRYAPQVIGSFFAPKTTKLLTISRGRSATCQLPGRRSSMVLSAIFAQALNYTRILVEAEDHIAEQVGRCFVARDQQQAAEAEQFHVSQSLPIDLSSEQRADQVVLRMLATLLKHLCEVAIHTLDILKEGPAFFF